MISTHEESFAKNLLSPPLNPITAEEVSLLKVFNFVAETAYTCDSSSVVYYSAGNLFSALPK